MSVPNSVKALARTVIPDSLLRILFSRGIVGGLIGMTTKAEQSYYRKAAGQVSKVDGAVVDLGCWLCSTSISLAQGLLEGHGGRTDEKVHAVDRFIWESWMDPMLIRVSRDFEPGDDFMSEARNRIRRYARNIELIKADLTEYEWKRGPIKLLLVDTMKTWELGETVTKAFFPSLTEGSLLLHQDFKHYWTPWIHILQYRLRDHFAFEYDVVPGGTLAFRTVKTVSPEAAAAAVDFESCDEDEIGKVFDYSMGLVGKEGQPSVASAHVMFFVHRGMREAAEKQLEIYAQKNYLLVSNFGQAHEAVKGM